MGRSLYREGNRGQIIRMTVARAASRALTVVSLFMATNESPHPVNQQKVYLTLIMFYNLLYLMHLIENTGVADSLPALQRESLKYSE